MGTIYLIHLDEPSGDPGRPRMSARHYVGWTNGVSVDERFAQHQSGAGARILAAANRRGIAYRVVRVWKRQSRKDERRMKNNGHFASKCPACQEER
jgi:predicted GIY-YIG superfamily endonuclease